MARLHYFSHRNEDSLAAAALLKLPLQVTIPLPRDYRSTAARSGEMNPEVEEQSAVSRKHEKVTTKKQHILQRRLKEQISESRMLEVLDRQLQGDRPRELHRNLDSNQEDAEDELVCVSTMVAVEPSAAPAEYEQRVCGVLKTVRCMHRQRVNNEPQRDENQSDHSKLKSIATLKS